MFLVKLLLGGGKISIKAEASMFTGASLHEYWSISLVESSLNGKENSVITEAYVHWGVTSIKGFIDAQVWRIWLYLEHLCLFGYFLSWVKMFLHMSSICSMVLLQVFASWRFGIIGFFLYIYYSFAAGLSIGN